VRLNDASINSFCNRPFSRWRKAPLGTNQSEAIDVPSGKCQQKPMNKIPHIFEKGLFFACSFEEINGRDDPAISWWIGGKASSFGSQCAAFRWYISMLWDIVAWGSFHFQMKELETFHFFKLAEKDEVRRWMTHKQHNKYGFWLNFSKYVGDTSNLSQQNYSNPGSTEKEIVKVLSVFSASQPACITVPCSWHCACMTPSLAKPLI